MRNCIKNVIEEDQYVLCPGCKSASKFIGKIPATNQFAGRVFSQPLDGGSLYKCNVCDLRFRWPRMDKVQLDEFYIKGDVKTWSAPAYARPDWLVGLEWLNSHNSNDMSVLDVGCFDGTFLKLLPSKYKRFGIELHPEASKIARSEGVSIIGSDFGDIKGEFDFIFAYDVVEHVESPSLFISNCLKALKKDGRLIISTGNVESPSFRFMGSKYWYCTIAEHLSFIGPTWFEKNAKINNFKIDKILYFSHSTTSFIGKVKEIFLNWVYCAFPFIFSLLRKIGFGDDSFRNDLSLLSHPPVWMSAKDHFIVLVKKDVKQTI